jgi:hypothetical protein
MSRFYSDLLEGVELDPEEDELSDLVSDFDSAGFAEVSLSEAPLSEAPLLSLVSFLDPPFDLA